jgi:hypothetical protein
MSIKEKISGTVLKIKASPKRLYSYLLSKFLSIVLSPLLLIGMVLGFAVGARLHETGNIKFQSSLKGSSVFVTGACTLSGTAKVVKMAEDQIKVTLVNTDSISGVIRQTREIVDCELNKVVIESLPPLNVLLYPSRIQALDTARIAADQDETGGILHKVLVVTGACSSKDNKDLPPFVNEDVEVLKVEKLQDSTLSISGIRLSDKALVTCLSTLSNYHIKPLEVVAAKPEVKDFVGQDRLVTSRCLADKPQEAGGLLVDLSKSRVFITSNSFDSNGRILKFSGDAHLENSKHQKLIVKINCDATKYPTILEDFNPRTETLVPSTDAEMPKYLTGEENK